MHVPYPERPYVPAKDPLTAIPPSRHPFQFWMMFAMVLSGAGNFFAAGSPALDASVDPFFHKVWAFTLFGGGILALVGTFWRDRVMGLLMERAALVTIGISCSIYSVVYVWWVGWSAGVGGAMTFSLGVACVWRVIHVNRELRVLRRFMEHTGVK